MPREVDPVPDEPVAIDPRLQDLIPGFLQGRQKDVRAIRTALAEGDYDAIAVVGHTMHGIGGSYGFSFISRCGEQIENAARARQASVIEAATARLAHYLTTVVLRPGS